MVSHWYRILFFLLSTSVIYICCSEEGGSPLPRAIVHIGPPKTGSTFLQTNIWHNRKKIARLGYLVAMTKNLNGYNFWTTVQDRKIDPFLTEIVSRNQSLILSSEFFAFGGENEIKVLKELLVGFNVTIVAFHREKTAMIRSIWSENNKLIQTPKGFNDWSNWYFGDFETKSWSLNKLNLFADAFGYDSIRLISFDGAVQHSNPFFVVMNDVMGLPLDSFTIYTNRLNPSPSTYIIHLLVTISELFSEKGELCTTPSHLMFSKQFENVTEKLNTLPQTCTQLREWQRLLSEYDNRVFAKYGKPLYFPETQPEAASICTLNLPAVLADPEKYDLLLYSIPFICQGKEEIDNPFEKQKREREIERERREKEERGREKRERKERGEEKEREEKEREEEKERGEGERREK